MIKLGITGTDTGVGKTVVACDIIKKLCAEGKRVAAMKPAETGIANPEDPTSDAVLLKHAAGATHPINAVRPYLFQHAVAPLVAARLNKRSIDMTVLDNAFDKLTQGADAIVVEGAGGLLVPFTDTENFATIAKRWNLELIIVAANKLGVLNHTLLTVKAARDHGVSIHSIVLNTIPGASRDSATETNFSTLKGLLKDIPVTLFPC